MPGCRLDAAPEYDGPNRLSRKSSLIRPCIPGPDAKDSNLNEVMAETGENLEEINDGSCRPNPPYYTSTTGVIIHQRLYLSTVKNNINKN